MLKEDLIFKRICRQRLGPEKIGINCTEPTTTLHSVIITSTVNGVPIRLSNERWNHICKRHPEFLNEKNKVIETIQKPDIILKGDYGEKLAIRFYDATPLTSKYLVVVYKEINKKEGFVLTAYFTRKYAKWREVLWKL